MKRFRDAIQKMKKKALRFLQVVIRRIPVVEIILVLSVLIIVICLFRPLIMKLIRNIIFR